ncbi:sensor histidine kinase [Amnibacterium flavum]|uniref:histidine kinase n=1 Tax=Amnibacterium flavum TaxID=2173173 RepID=A0A2V1HN09_9MICO|nr:sensor domain-containing protein [Amnibacterium flavum]PVZ93986.1 hypothetical protein DDQ50_09510 [Amnibacterium flavum]
MSTESAALAGDAATPAVAVEPTRPRAFYWRLWSTVPRELGYLVPAFPIALAVSMILITAFSGAASLIAVFVGVILVPFVLLGARFAGRFDVARLRYTGLPRFDEPRLDPPFRGKPFTRALVDVTANPHNWLAYVHGALIAPTIALVSFTIWFTWVATTLALVLTPIWLLIPFSRGSGGLGGYPSVQAGEWNIAQALNYAMGRGDSPGLAVGLVILTAVVGLMLLALFPFVSRGLTWAHWGAARLLLSRFRSEEMGEEVAALSESRRAAVVAEDQALRRLERDIHDGPQQRLLRLQLDLASAERRLEEDPEKTRELLASARVMTQDALNELRALTQGFAPPILQDRGLAAALESLGSRSAVPVDVRVDLGSADLPSEVERGAYFVAAELVSNAVKHSSASRIGLLARVQDGSDGEPVGRTLRITVDDDGTGGARPVAGHGLAGLTERVTGMRGTLSIDSPVGGPTRVTAILPLQASPDTSIA